MHDLNGAAVDVGGMPFTATLGDSEVLYHINITDNLNGSYSAHYVLQRTGIFELRIMLNGGKCNHHQYNNNNNNNTTTNTHYHHCYHHYTST